MKKSITIIVAAAENNAIGKDNDLIWSLPNDLKRFKKLTSGHSIIMGRKTFDSFPGLLPNRKHIVISYSIFKVIHNCNFIRKGNIFISRDNNVFSVW